MPVPLVRLIYLALGARLGKNTYSSGIILDPPLVEIGANSVVGQYALLVPHVIESKRLAHYRIRIGNNLQRCPPLQPYTRPRPAQSPGAYSTRLQKNERGSDLADSKH